MTSENRLPKTASWRTPLLVIVAGCIIAMIGFGIRSVFGLFLEPMTSTHGWSRETFAIAMAIQNLLWGIGVPIAGALAVGGRLYDTTGTYDAVWWAGVVLGLTAAFIHLPINEHPLPRLAVESRQG